MLRRRDADKVRYSTQLAQLVAMVQAQTGSLQGIGNLQTSLEARIIGIGRQCNRYEFGLLESHSTESPFGFLDGDTRGFTRNTELYV